MKRTSLPLLRREFMTFLGGAVCCLIGKALNAVVVRQNYSRLVID
jgi:hypothetical protein